jgi:DNA-binding transcriptional LysR family regulator
MELSSVEMELRDLAAFVMVVDTGGFTRAGERLHLVQSAVSMAVKRLEREVDLLLLERHPGGVAPTPAGAALADHARIILNSVARAHQDMEAYRGLSKGAVSIGILPTATPLLLPSLLRRMRETYPGLEVKVEESSAHELVDQVRLGELDLAVLFLPALTEDLTVVEIGRLELAVAVALDHPLAKRRKVRMSALINEAWVTYPQPNPGRRWLDEACSMAGYRARVTAEVLTLAELKTFVEAGVGIAMIPPGAAAAENRAGLFHLLSIAPPMQVGIGYAYDPRQRGQAVSALRDAVDSLAPLTDH